MNNTLQRLKRHLRQLVMPLALTAGLLPSQSLLAEEVHLDRIIAVVNNGVVMESELKHQVERIRAQLQAKNTPLPPDSVLIRQVLDRLIVDSIQLQMAREQGIKVDDETLNQTLSRIAESSGMTLPQFKAALEAEGQDYGSVREQVREEMLITQLQQREVNRRIQVTDLEVRNYLDSKQGQQQGDAELQLGHILIATPSEASPEEVRQAADKAGVIYQQLRNGADFAQTAVAHSSGQNALQGGDIGWRRLSELPGLFGRALESLEPGDLSQPVRSASGYHIFKVMDKRGGKVRLVDQTHARHILIKPTEIRSSEQARVLAERLYSQLQNGADFAALATQYSDDPGSASSGGDLGWVLPGQMVPAFEQMMNDTAPGDFSRPFESPFGWHIVQVLERRQQDFGEQIMANEARETLRRRKFEDELQNWLREIKAQAYIEIKS